MGHDTQHDTQSKKWNIDEWKDFAKSINDTEQPDNHISNLVLLDYQTNRAYKDALFFGKRQKIIEKDRANAYIPICTKNVFLKYYTKKPDTTVAWTDEDKQGYWKIILDCIEEMITDLDTKTKDAVNDKIQEAKKHITEA